MDEAHLMVPAKIVGAQFRAPVERLGGPLINGMAYFTQPPNPIGRYELRPYDWTNAFNI